MKNHDCNTVRTTGEDKDDQFIPDVNIIHIESVGVEPSPDYKLIYNHQKPATIESIAHDSVHNGPNWAVHAKQLQQVVQPRCLDFAETRSAKDRIQQRNNRAFPNAIPPGRNGPLDCSVLTKVNHTFFVSSDRASAQVIHKQVHLPCLRLPKCRIRPLPLRGRR